jgi:hypothetical protein
MTHSKKVLVFSIALEGFEHTFSDCIRSHMQYCKKNGYKYLLIKKSPYRLQPHEAAWLKVPLMLASLSAGSEWCFFLDADCEVRPHAPDFTTYLDKIAPEHSIFMAPGFSGRINSGVIFGKNEANTLEFLSTILAHADSEVPDPEDVAPYENGHFIFWGKKNPSLYLLEHSLWNNNSNIDPDSYIQHYSRGKIRDLYLESQASRKNNLERLLESVSTLFYSTKRMEKRPLMTETDVIISESMQQLLAFYVKEYPDCFANISERM